MRNIVFIKAVNTGIGEAGLEICSHCTPLVEPQQDGSVYLDISGCGSANQIVGDLAEKIASLVGELMIGWASSRLLAFVAVQADLGSKSPKGACRWHNTSRAAITEVIAGCEADFLSQLPLKQFPPLKPQEVKKLARAAFSTVGEIARLPRQRLALLVGKRADLLARTSQGLDDTPVVGLYPPRRLAVPLGSAGEEEGMERIGQHLSLAAQTLAGLLGERGAGASRVRLEIFGYQNMIRERRLSQPCFESRRLNNILLGLWRQLPPFQGSWQGRVVLEEVAVLNWQEQDLFTLPVGERERHNSYLEDALHSLEARFPGQIRLGPAEVERREQVLALWDPWRFPADHKALKGKAEVQ